MNPGKLDILATINYDVGTTRSDSGYPIPSWTEFQTIWCQRIGVSAKEVVVEDQIVNFNTEEFKYRTTDDSGIKPAMRLVNGTEVYDIIEVQYIDRMYSKLICQKVDND